MHSDTRNRIDDVLAEASGHWVREINYTLSFYSRHCESEIERVLMAAFLCAQSLRWWGDFAMFTSTGGWIDSSPSGADGARELEAAPQVGVLGYRVDFLIRAWSWTQKKWELTVVECDGHDFHERTKEQAELDRSRDRAMIAAGYRVLRFTGREIWRDPLACVAQIFSIATGMPIGSIGSCPDGST